MAGALKMTTGLTGLAVAKHPHRELGDLYSRIMRALDSLPKESAYRRYTEKIVQERHQILKQNLSVDVVEKKIGCGQVEELIIQAKNELSLAKNMQTWKPWESLAEQPPEHQWTWPAYK